MHWIKQLAASVALAAVLAPAAHAQGKEVVIAYQDMVVPWRYAQEMKEVEKQTGYKVSFRQFSGGGDVIRAMASGQIAIGEAGTSPIASALSQGLEVELFWILDDINAAEAMVARNGTQINGVADLKGKRVGVPFVSTTHYHTLVALEEAKVNPKDVKIMNMRPPEVAAAWERGDIDATFIWDPVLAKVKRSGKVLVTSGQIAAQTGKSTFDGMIANKKFAHDNPDFMVKFVRVLAAADDNYRNNKAAWNADSPMVKAVARITGAKADEVPASMALYSFPTLQEQASARWLGGGAASALRSAALFLKEQGTIQNVLPDYSTGVNAEWVRRAAQ
ncbi:taurine ABC transporter substrate-binding protein [Cupriavidus sp. USMAA2-4]|uniref:Taurine ABC transporter substrate-binding protein n=1 Tax=Cupriavidus malaysiensis TaxID=367825 RepID=A0ABM6FE10_9BURK|nr:MULTISPECIES: taurine ABC transporter substrate-binding protein [Cupriavidus]AOY94571.1 taurine ABC transporter substrate-binding protein [Cupriavidus sp. USMAA2-4]AOZ10068.1 taurine ABC transporter substrate-binding protein [Cupriavidus malaysiensis]